MNSREFVESLAQENQEILDRLGPTETLEIDDPHLDLVVLLKMALKNELEATELAARWMESTEDIRVKLAFARQIGDEAKHYRMIQERLKELGVNTDDFNPVAQGYSPLFNYLLTLQDTVERVTGGQFTREAIAAVKNQQFVDLCAARGDEVTARMYRDTIQVDENYHHLLGRQILERLATTPEAQERARKVARKTLELAEELQNAMREKAGIHHAPGC